MKTLTYGRLPKFKEFWDAFYNVGDRFKFQNDKRVGDANMTCKELWDELQKAAKEWEDGENSFNEEAGDWASCVLQVLGFEWV